MQAGGSGEIRVDKIANGEKPTNLKSYHKIDTINQLEFNGEYMDGVVIGDNMKLRSSQENRIHTSLTNSLNEVDTVKPTPVARNNVGQPVVKEHIDESQVGGKLEKQIMKEIQERPINILGEPTLISNCPHDCNNQGLCQRVFVKVKTSENPDTFSYEPQYSCACKDNFKGPHCGECAKGFFGKNCYACPRNPADHIICGIEGICDDGIDGTGRCACLDHRNNPDVF